MGSCPEGTLCAYCGEHPASYIPDHCIGPICFGMQVVGEDVFVWEGCWHVAQRLSWGVVNNKYIKRCWLAKIRPVRQTNHVLSDLGVDAYLNIANFLFNVH
jgi:hypothetical protein